MMALDDYIPPLPVVEGEADHPPVWRLMIARMLQAEEVPLWSWEEADNWNQTILPLAQIEAQEAYEQHLRQRIRTEEAERLRRENGFA
jgi:hypothetical protein